MAMYEEKLQYYIGAGTAGVADIWDGYLKAYPGRLKIKPSSIVIRKTGGYVYGAGTSMATDDGLGTISGTNLTGTINYTTGYITLTETGAAFGAGDSVNVDFITEGVSTLSNDWVWWRQGGAHQLLSMSNRQYDWGTTTRSILKNAGHHILRSGALGNDGIQYYYTGLSNRFDTSDPVSVAVVGQYNSTIMTPQVYCLIKLDTTDSPNYEHSYAFGIYDATYVHFMGGRTFGSDMGIGNYSVRISKSGGWGFATYTWYGVRLDCYRIGNDLRFFGYLSAGTTDLEKIFSDPQWTLIMDCAHVNGNATPVKYDIHVPTATYTQGVAANGFGAAHTTPFYSGKTGFGIGRGVSSQIGHCALVQLIKKPS